MLAKKLMTTTDTICPKAITTKPASMIIRKSFSSLRIAFLGIAMAAFTASCSSTGGKLKVEELAEPVLDAVAHNNVGKLYCLQAPEEHIPDLWQVAGAKLGRQYYNKYTTSYRDMTLKASIHTDNDIAQFISDRDGLDWSQVEVGDIDKEDISTPDGAKYTQVTIWLRFPQGTYHLKYSAAFAASNWYLLDDIWLGRPIVPKG